MDPQVIAGILREKFPEEIREVTEFRGQVSVTVAKERVREIMELLHDNDDYCFSHLQDLCGVDHLGRKEPRFEVVYQLYSIRHRHAIRIKAEVPEGDPKIDSVVPIWDGANWHERECYDLFGIAFTGHPDLRRILLPEDWEGHPLRKDYPLQSNLGEREWKGMREVLAMTEKNKEYETK